MAASDVGAGNGGGGRSGGPPGGQERIVSYQPEERYWTDYLRIALPVIGLLIMIGVLWYWLSQIVGGESEEPPATIAAAADVAIETPATPAPTETPVTAPAAATEGPPPAATETPAPIETPPAVITTAAPDDAAVEPTAPAGEPAPIVTNFEPGTTVVITDEGVRMRSEATVESDIVEELSAGTQLTITGLFAEAGELDWWPVENPTTGATGFVREDFLAEA